MQPSLFAMPEITERVRKALEALEAVEARRKKDKEQARASTTDPDARVMKMADGGFRPAYNGQLAVDTKSQVIVGVDVTNSGGDMGQLAPMVEKIQDLHGVAPKEMLVDGGFAKKEDIDNDRGPPRTPYDLRGTTTPSSASHIGEPAPNDRSRGSA